MPTIPGFEMKTIDLSKVELPFKLPFDLPKIDLPTIDLSKVELPELPFNFANVELPNIDLPTAEQVIDFFRDATLAGSGLVSLTAEKVAELQKQLVEALKAQIGKVRAAV